MTKCFLLPHSFKKVGWLLFLVGVIAGITCMVLGVDFDDYLKVRVFTFFGDGFFKMKAFSFVENGILDELITVFIIVGGVLVGFSKTKVEDEYISQLRLNSLVWSVYVSYAILFLATIFVYGMPFLDVMMVNMFTVLLFFIVRFHIQLYKANRL